MQWNACGDWALCKVQGCVDDGNIDLRVRNSLQLMAVKCSAVKKKTGKDICCSRLNWVTGFTWICGCFWHNDIQGRGKLQCTSVRKVESVEEFRIKGY